MGLDNKTLAAAKSYVKKSMTGAGAVKGKDGKDAPTITAVNVNENNVLLTTLSDGTTLNGGTIKTVSGVDGKNGKDGLQGIKGDKGDPGEKGLQGIQGIKGEKGDDGYPFLIYKEYTDISDFSASDFPQIGLMFMIRVNDATSFPVYRYTGNSGTPYSFITNLSSSEYIKGEKGDKGDTGEQGIQGVAGKDGTTYSPTVGTVASLNSDQNATVDITVDEDTKTAKFNFGIPKGDKGNQGEQGEKGEPGIDGISPTIDVVKETDSEYILKITDKNGSKTTPNLRGINSSENIPGNPSTSNNGLQQNTFMNISNKDEKSIAINSKLEKIIVQAYKYIDGEHNIVNVLKTFNNEDSDNFNYNTENIAFDNVGMHIMDSYELKLNPSENGEYISESFDLDDFVSLRQTNIGDNSTLKPDSSILIGSGLQMNDYEIGEYSTIGYTSPHGLFNGVAVNEWNSGNVCYMNGGNYFIITFKQPVNIYRSGTDDWNSYYSKFQIQKLNVLTQEFADIEIEQITSGIGSKSWELTIKELPQGTYKFILPSGGYRIDSEWFLEIPSFSYLLKNDGKFYCINENYYDTETETYIPVDYFDYSNIECDPLFSHPEYLNGNMPVNKFSGNLQLIQNKQIPTIINGIKSSSELVVASGDINNGLASTINSITLSNEISDNATIKIAFSFDSGNTWNTFNGDNVESLNIDIPTDKYPQFSMEQKTKWENAKNIISEYGIDIIDFNDDGFNSKLMRAFEENGTAHDTIRFAYVLIRPTYDDECSTTELKWDFNAKGHMDLMIPGTEYSFSIYQHEIIFKSLMDSDLIKVNILS